MRARMLRAAIQDEEKTRRIKLDDPAIHEVLRREVHSREEQLAREVVAELSASSSQDLGRVVKVLMPRLEGRAEGKMVRDLVGCLLGPVG